MGQKCNFLRKLVSRLHNDAAGFWRVLPPWQRRQTHAPPTIPPSPPRVAALTDQGVPVHRARPGPQDPLPTALGRPDAISGDEASRPAVWPECRHGQLQGLPVQLGNRADHHSTAKLMVLPVGTYFHIHPKLRKINTDPASSGMRPYFYGRSLWHLQPQQTELCRQVPRSPDCERREGRGRHWGRSAPRPGAPAGISWLAGRSSLLATGPVVRLGTGPPTLRMMRGPRPPSLPAGPP